MSPSTGDGQARDSDTIPPTTSQHRRRVIQKMNKINVVSATLIPFVLYVRTIESFFMA